MKKLIEATEKRIKVQKLLNEKKKAMAKVKNLSVNLATSSSAISSKSDNNIINSRLFN